MQVHPVAGRLIARHGIECLFAATVLMGAIISALKFAWESALWIRADKY